MFSEEGDRVWSNKADEWLGQRFLPHNPRPNSVKNADQPKLRGEGSSTLAFSIWIYSPFLPCLSLPYSHSHRLWIGGTSPAQLDVLRKNASVMLKLLDIKNLESKHKKGWNNFSCRGCVVMVWITETLPSVQPQPWGCVNKTNGSSSELGLWQEQE